MKIDKTMEHAPCSHNDFVVNYARHIFPYPVFRKKQINKMKCLRANILACLKLILFFKTVKLSRKSEHKNNRYYLFKTLRIK